MLAMLWSLKVSSFGRASRIRVTVWDGRHAREREAFTDASAQVRSCGRGSVRRHRLGSESRWYLANRCSQSRSRVSLKKGTTHIEEATSGPRHASVVDLKDVNIPSEELV